MQTQLVQSIYHYRYILRKSIKAYGFGWQFICATQESGSTQEVLCLKRPARLKT